MIDVSSPDVLAKSCKQNANGKNAIEWHRGFIGKVQVENRCSTSVKVVSHQQDSKISRISETAGNSCIDLMKLVFGCLLKPAQKSISSSDKVAACASM